MWNLAYGHYGESVKLGTLADPGKPTNRKAQKKARAHRDKIADRREAGKAFHIRFVPQNIPRKKRFDFLRDGLTKGGWLDNPLLSHRRKEFELIRGKLLPLKAALCYVCRVRATVRHHIIPLCKGGSNDLSNLVPLCRRCHERLHPWITEHPSMAAGILPVTASNLRAEELTTSPPPKRLCLQPQVSVEA